VSEKNSIKKNQTSCHSFEPTLNPTIQNCTR